MRDEPSTYWLRSERTSLLRFASRLTVDYGNPETVRRHAVTLNAWVLAAADLDGLTVHQWANDWISYNGGPKGGGIVNPRRVLLTADEVAHVRTCRDQGDHSGRFWDRWDLADDGRFTPKGRPS